MFKNILFATTSSALCNDTSDVAFEIARKHNSNLYIFYVFGVPTRAGVPHTEILRFARKKDIDLIIMGPHTRNEKEGLKYKSTLGSTMQDVAQKAPEQVVQSEVKMK